MARMMADDGGRGFQWRNGMMEFQRQDGGRWNSSKMADGGNSSGKMAGDGIPAAERQAMEFQQQDANSSSGLPSTCSVFQCSFGHHLSMRFVHDSSVQHSIHSSIRPFAGPAADWFSGPDVAIRRPTGTWVNPQPCSALAICHAGCTALQCAADRPCCTYCCCCGFWKLRRLA